jgi:ABC-type multidrug transport system permease subunit
MNTPRSFSRIWAMTVARTKEFYRDRGSMTWNFFFPFIVVTGFAFAYSGPPKPDYKIGYFEPSYHQASSAIFKWSYVQFIPFTSKDDALEKVRKHQVDLLFDQATHTYWINNESSKGIAIERMLGSLKDEAWTKAEVSGRAVRYVDWLVPGIIGLNMMFSALFGVGYVIVRYRKNGVLKRLKATPVNAFEFLSAQILSRLFVILFTTLILITGAVLFVHVPIEGRVVDLAIIYTLGAICLVSMGLVISARVRSEEVAGGLLQMMTWPMMFLSSVWFSLEGMNPLIAQIAMIFPLTHVVNGARNIMIEGQGLSLWSVLYLSVLAVFFLALGALGFRWE